MSTETREEILFRDSQSRPLRSRLSVKPHHPDYDAHVLAHMRSKVVVEPTRGCWLWQGFIHPNVVRNGKLIQRGYGMIGYRAKTHRAHRVMWMVTKGPIPAGMHVCHTCDVRRCVNPDHLWLGTNQQNITDMTMKGRGPCGEKKMKTHCIRGHELSGDNVIIYHGGKHRACKACQKFYRSTPEGKLSAQKRLRKLRDKRRAEHLAQAVTP